MNLSQEQIARLAKLTALQSDNSIEISSVIDSFDTIAKVDTSEIEQNSRSGNSTLNLRVDEVIEDENLPDKLLKCSPQKTAAHQIVLAGIMQWD